MKKTIFIVNYSKWNKYSLFIYIIYGICKFYIFDFCYSIYYNQFINLRKGFKNKKQKSGGKKMKRFREAMCHHR